jgi:hypothetical protein
MTFGLLGKFGFGFASKSAASSYSFVNAEAAAWVAAMSTAPTNARKALIDNLVGSLKSAGFWAKLDWISLLAAHSNQAARLNGINPAQSMTAVNSPIFTTDQGYTGDGVSAHLDLGVTHASLAKAVQDDQSWSIGVRNEGSRVVGNWALGLAGSGATTGLNLAVSPAVNVRIGSSNSGALSDASSAGRWCASRKSSTTASVYKSGVAVNSALSNPSSPNAALNITLLRASASYGNSQVSYFCIGSGLTTTEQASIDAIFATYLNAIGA